MEARGATGLVIGGVNHQKERKKEGLTLPYMQRTERVTLPSFIFDRLFGSFFMLSALLFFRDKNNQRERMEQFPGLTFAGSPPRPSASLAPRARCNALADLSSFSSATTSATLTRTFDDNCPLFDSSSFRHAYS